MTYKEMNLKTKVECNKFQISLNKEMIKILSNTYLDNPTMDNFNIFITNLSKSTNDNYVDEYIKNQRLRLKNKN